MTYHSKDVTVGIADSGEKLQELLDQVVEECKKKALNISSK